MRTNFTFLRSILVVFFAITSLRSQAQVPNTAAGYIFSAVSGTYTAITGGTAVSSILTDDFTTQNIPIGFTFPFAGSTYTQVSVCSNGWMSLANANPSAAASRDNTVANMSTIAPMLMPLWDDLNGAYSPSGTGQAYYLTEGSSPNRVFTFEWSGWKWIWSGTGNNVLSYEVKLYESGRIEFVYNQGPDAVNQTAAATIGIANSGTDYQSLSNTSSSPVSSTTVFTDVISAKPASGQKYIWDVPCGTPAGLTSSNITNVGATISWSAVNGSQGYEYAVSTVATPPSGAGTPATATSLSLTGLQNGTVYYVYVRNKCGSTSFSGWTSTSFTTIGCIKPANVLISNVTDSTIDVLWSKMQDATSYDYVVDFSNQSPAAGINNTTGITAHLSTLIPNSKYYFHVRSRCFGLDSSAWRLDSFITLFVCYAPQLQVNFLGTNDPYIFWNPIPSAISYEYALTNFQAPLPSFGTEIFNTFISLKLPNDGKDYYLHVRTKCNSQFTASQWATVALRTSPANIMNTPGKDVINIYPNPVTDRLHVSGAKGMRYEITDITGRTIGNGLCDQADHSINISRWNRGVYILKLKGDAGESQFRFVKQ